jgi:hypothetical protein
MKKLKSLLIIIFSLLIFINGFVALAEEKSDTTVFYFNAPEGFSADNQVICTAWSTESNCTLNGLYLGNNLYKFQVENIKDYSNMVFNDANSYNRTSFLYGSNGLFPEETYEDFSENLIDIDGKVFTDSIEYYGNDFSHDYSFGRWMEYSTWERKDKFDNYITQKGGTLPTVIELVTPDFWYRYKELYTDKENYILVFGSGDEKNNTPVCDTYGNYQLKQDETYSPDPFGYYIYLFSEDEFITLREAVDENIPNINNVFEEYGLGKVIGNVNTPSNPTVTEPTTKPTTETIQKKTTVSLSKSSANVYVKGTTAIKATVKNGVGKTTYKSSNTNVAKVSSKGIVTAVKKGTAKITVTNNKVSKIFTIKVLNPKLNKTSVSVAKGKTFTLKITGKVGKAKFSTSNKKIATVNSKGKITVNKKAKKGKICYITVKTNGITLKCKVKVK